MIFLYGLLRFTSLLKIDEMTVDAGFVLFNNWPNAHGTVPATATPEKN